MNDLLHFENKKIRAKVIKEYLRKSGVNKVVCFSCGNATKELKNVGIDTLSVCPDGDLLPHRWFHSNDFSKYFPNFFNATSGYLPMDLMLEISKEFKKKLGNLPETVYVPCGSGETIVCLKIAYPNVSFVAVYNDNNPATTYDVDSPLFPLVKLISDKIIVIPKKGG